MFEADEAEVVEGDGDGDRGGDGEAGEEGGAEALGEGEAGHGGGDGDEAAGPGPPVGLAGFVSAGKMLTEEELEEEEAEEAGKVDGDAGPEGGAELLVEFGVGAGLEGVGGTGGDGDKDDEEGHAGLRGWLVRRSMSERLVTTAERVSGVSGFGGVGAETGSTGGGGFGGGEVLREEDGGGAEDGLLGRGGEPVAFVREDPGLVGDVGGGEGVVEFVGFGDGDDSVPLAVEDEGGWEGGGEGGGGVGAREAAGDFDDGFEGSGGSLGG